jgi:hypothetical protein
MKIDDVDSTNVMAVVAFNPERALELAKKVPSKASDIAILCPDSALEIFKASDNRETSGIISKYYRLEDDTTDDQTIT